MMNIGHSAVAQWGLQFLGLCRMPKYWTAAAGVNHIRLLENCPRGDCQGIDYSDIGVEKAQKLNRRAIRDGRCAVCQGSVEHVFYGCVL